MIQMIPPPSPRQHFYSCFPLGLYHTVHLALSRPLSPSSVPCWLCARWLPALGAAPFLSRCAPAAWCSSVRLRSAAAGAGPPELEELLCCGGRRAGSGIQAPGRILRGAGTGGCTGSPGRTPARSGGATMGCSSSALNKAGDRNRLRSGEQGNRPHPGPVQGFRVGSLPGGSERCDSCPLRPAGGGLMPEAGSGTLSAVRFPLKVWSGTSVTQGATVWVRPTRQAWGPGLGLLCPPARVLRGVKSLTPRGAAFSSTDE